MQVGHVKIGHLCWLSRARRNEADDREIAADCCRCPYGFFPWAAGDQIPRKVTGSRRQVADWFFCVVQLRTVLVVTPTSGKVHWPGGIEKIALPPYSPELNPAERWFEALRRIFANAIFDTLEDLEAALTEALRPYWQNPAKLQRLVGYPWWCHAVAGVNSNSSPSERK